MKKRVLIVTAALSLVLTACAKESVSVGVIGGADGPTAITVSTPGKTEPETPAPAEAPASEPQPEPEPEPEAPAPEPEPAETPESGLTPVTADQLVEGTYPIQVDSSSEKFRITACELTAANGTLTAVMHMGGQGYLRVYMGTGEQAETAPETDFIPFHEEPDGTHTFTVPVEALDKELPCAAFSKNKEIWYDRTLVFRADSLPPEALSNAVTPETLSLADGEYTSEVTLSGGSGKAKVESPARLTVTGGKATASIVWGSPNYDYMRIGEEKFLPTQTEGNAAFEIPVSVFDRPFTVFADTTAMSEPHEIEYTLCFSAPTAQ